MTPTVSVVWFLAILVVFFVVPIAGLYASKMWQQYQDVRVWKTSRLDATVNRVMDSAWWLDRQDRQLARWAAKGRRS